MVSRNTLAVVLAATILTLASGTASKAGTVLPEASYTVTATPDTHSKKHSKAHGHRTCAAEGSHCKSDRDCCKAGRYVCTDAPWEGRGEKLCLMAPPKCYQTGERCIGAPGKPYVPYARCCNAKDACMPYPKYGYGSFCVPVEHSHKPDHGKAHEGDYEYIEYSPEPKHDDAHDHKHDDAHDHEHDDGHQHEHKEPMSKSGKASKRPTMRPSTHAPDTTTVTKAPTKKAY